MRPSWDDVWMSVAYTVSERSTCIKYKVGAVIVCNRNNTVLSTGYNGVKRGETHCEDIFMNSNMECPNVRQEHRIWSMGCEIHAEINALNQLDHIPKSSCTLYTTLSPCPACANKIEESNFIERVVYDDHYKGNMSVEGNNSSFYTLLSNNILLEQI